MTTVQTENTPPKRVSALQQMGVDPILTISEISAWLQLAEPTIWRWIAEQEFPKGFKLGRSTRWKLSVVQAWVDRQEADAAHAAIEGGGSV